MSETIIDPKGLIREAYKIEGITLEECKSIFLDWAMGAGDDPKGEIRILLDRHASGRDDHPMTQVLRDGLGAGDAPRRRGGWRGRRDAD